MTEMYGGGLATVLAGFHERSSSAVGEEMVAVKEPEARSQEPEERSQ